MTHTQLQKRLERLENTLRPSTVIYEVILRGEDEPEPPHKPGVKVIQVTLGAMPPEGAWQPTR